MNPSSDSSPERGRRSRSPIRVDDSDSPASPPPDEQGVPTLPYGGFHHPDSPPPPRRHHSPSLLASLRRIIEDHTTPPALRALALEQEKALQAKPSSTHFEPQPNADMETDSASPATSGRRCHSPPQTDEEDAQKKRPRTGPYPEVHVRSYAEALVSTSTKTPQAPGPAAPSCSQANADPSSAKEPKYPPLIVDNFPNWTQHIKIIKDKLGFTPNARAYERGVRFTPRSKNEYRLLQRYLSQREKEGNLHWFSFSLDAEKSLKVAIKGLPCYTDKEEIKAELERLGFTPEYYVKHIKTRRGRAGCIFFAQLKRTANLIPDIYNISELLGLPGIKIEGWLARKRPAQCHRCQQFRHSSHCCHRPPACVRCGEEHLAKDCPRPREDPPTCANCKGAHTANNAKCPVFKREMRNKKAGTSALLKANRNMANQRPTQPSTTMNPTLPTTLMLEANNPSLKRGPRPRSRQGRHPHPSTAAPAYKAATSANAQEPSSKGPIVKLALTIFQDIIQAMNDGQDPLPIIMMGMTKLFAQNE